MDKLIDLAAPPPKGTGVQNIRECIIESKMTFDVSADDWQAYLKEKIMSNIERYTSHNVIRDTDTLHTISSNFREFFLWGPVVAWETAVTAIEREKLRD